MSIDIKLIISFIKNINILVIFLLWIFYNETKFVGAGYLRPNTKKDQKLIHVIDFIFIILRPVRQSSTTAIQNSLILPVSFISSNF